MTQRNVAKSARALVVNKERVLILSSARNRRECKQDLRFKEFFKGEDEKVEK